jgi:hypothetical protein
MEQPEQYEGGIEDASLVSAKRHKPDEGLVCLKGIKEIFLFFF